jgi:magnesium chelatase family protein
MGLAHVRSRALNGLQAPTVDVEVDLSNGLPSFTLVGLADTEVKEARERVRAAIHNSGLNFPHNKRITVNLAPADLPKDSGRFDLAIALGILAASEQVPKSALQAITVLGELSLSGSLRPVRGALATSLAMARDADSHALLLPAACAAEAAWVPGVRVARADHLLDVVAALQPEEPHTPGSPAQTRWAWVEASPPTPDASGLDMADVKGHGAAKRALAIAAAGGHSVLMVGPPGSGKSMLAARLPSLLPPLAQGEALESAAILSLMNRFDASAWGLRPMASPHHSASAAALIGGGSPPRPGAITQAHLGVLFMDELPEFNRAALEALREPLETGEVHISRAAHHACFPARFQLIAAMNPCPCGHLGHPQKACRCTPDQIHRYQGRLSGPLLDRIDIHVEVPAVDARTLLQAPNGEASASLAEAVKAARARAMARQGCANHALQADALLPHCQVSPAAQSLGEQAAERWQWSSRRLHRMFRVARSIADLADSATLEAEHLAEAMQYQRVLRGA